MVAKANRVISKQAMTERYFNELQRNHGASIVAYWDLNESSGTTANERVNSLDGTYTGTTLNDSSVLQSTDKVAFFDGFSDEVQVADDNLLDFETDSFSVLAWWRPNSSATGDSMLVTKGGSWQLWYDHDDEQLSVFLDDGTSTQFIDAGTSGDVPADRDYLISFVFDRGADTVNFRANKGKLSDSVALSVSGFSSSGDLFIGIRSDDLKDANGHMGPVFILDKAMTNTKIDNLFDLGYGSYLP